MSAANTTNTGHTTSTSSASSTLMTGSGKPGMLRKALLADAIVSGGAGVLLLAAAGPLGEAFGLSTTFLRAVGVALLPWFALLLAVATRPTPPRSLVAGIIGMNLLWVAGSALLLVAGWADPTGLGVAFVIAQAVAVLVFVELQVVGVRRG